MADRIGKSRGEGLPGNASFRAAALATDDVPVWNNTTKKWEVNQKSTFGTTDHTALTNIGTNTHAQIDTHIADATLHFTEASIDHGSIAGLADNDHPQYARIATNETITGAWTFNVDAVDFILQDPSLVTTNVLWYDNSELQMNIGTDDVDILFRGNAAFDTDHVLAFNNTVDATPDIDFGSEIGEKLSLWGTSYGIGIEGSTMFFRASGQFRWYPDTAPNTGDAGVSEIMNLSDAGLLTLPRLRLTATDDLSTSSTLHAFQVGPSTGANIGMDGNEIMARSNGATSTLNLNINGGTVATGGPLFTVGEIRGDSYIESATGDFRRGSETIYSNDGTTSFMYYNTDIVANTHASGLTMRAASPFLEFRSDDGVTRYGFMQQTSGGAAHWRSEVHGGTMTISAEDAGGTIRTIMSVDPDTTTTLRADTDLILEADVGVDFIYCDADADVALYHNATEEARTASSADSDQYTGMWAKDEAQTFRPLGFAVTPRTDFAANLTVTEVHWGRMLRHSSGTAHNLTFTSETRIPNDAYIIINNGTTSGGVVTLVSSGTTWRHYTGSAITSTTGNLSLASGGVAVVYKLTDTVHHIWGVGIS